MAVRGLEILLEAVDEADMTAAGVGYQTALLDGSIFLLVYEIWKLLVSRGMTDVLLLRSWVCQWQHRQESRRVKPHNFSGSLSASPTTSFSVCDNNNKSR